MTITMYGADWCGDCIRAKRWFADNEIAFDYVSLEAVPEAADIVLERNNGLKRIPVIVFGDDSHLTEPSNEALAAKMAELSGDSCATAAFDVVENSDAGRFELRRDSDVVSFASFSERDGVVMIPHVETMAEHRGQGYADRLLNGVLENLRASNRKVMPLCPFAARHVRENEQYHDLLAGS